MSYFRELKLTEVCERLSENKKTLIVFHARPDGDAVGSAFALRELLRMMDIPAVCACVDEVPDRLYFLMDGVQGSVVLEEDMPLDHERVISVDSASPKQVGSLFERLHRYVDLMIDHHASGTVYADHYIDPNASATGEIIYEIALLLLESGKISEIPPRVINGCYAAICSDTGCFRYANATPGTLRTAAELLELGANRSEIHRHLFEEKTLPQLQAEAEGVRRLSLYEEGRVAVVTFPYAVKAEMELSDEHLETLIDIPRSVAGVEIAVSIRQPEDRGFFRVSMRSGDDWNVSSICARFGGGGHVRAAGCSVEAATIEEAEGKILRAIRETMQ